MQQFSGKILEQLFLMLMGTPPKPAYKFLLQSTSWGLGAIAGIAFLWGGGLISIFFKIERLFAEFIGMGLAVVCGVISYIANITLEDLDVIEEDRKSHAQ